VLTQFSARSQFLLAQFSLKDWIVVISGLIGLVALMHTFFAGVFDASEALVAFPEIQALNVVAGDPIAVPVTILNESAYAPTQIKEVRAEARLSDGRSLALSPYPPNLPVLAPGQSTQVTLNGIASKDVFAEAAGSASGIPPPQDAGVRDSGDGSGPHGDRPAGRRLETHDGTATEDLGRRCRMGIASSSGKAAQLQTPHNPPVSGAGVPRGRERLCADHGAVRRDSHSGYHGKNG
jgi:hypothetical protein